MTMPTEITYVTFSQVTAPTCIALKLFCCSHTRCVVGWWWWGVSRISIRNFGRDFRVWCGSMSLFCDQFVWDVITFRGMSSLS